MPAAIWLRVIVPRVAVEVMKIPPLSPAPSAVTVHPREMVQVPEVYPHMRNRSDHLPLVTEKKALDAAEESHGQVVGFDVAASSDARS